MKFTGKLSGFDELDKMLKQLPRTVENRLLQKATLDGARAILPDMKAAAPVHDGAQSAASKLYGTGKKNIRVARLRRVKKGQKGARISTGNAFWLFFYELGTRNQPARPFFANTFRANAEKALTAMGISLGQGIENEASKYKGGKR